MLGLEEFLASTKDLFILLYRICFGVRLCEDPMGRFVPNCTPQGLLKSSGGVSGWKKKSICQCGANVDLVRTKMRPEG